MGTPSLWCVFSYGTSLVMVRLYEVTQYQTQDVPCVLTEVLGSSSQHAFQFPFHDSRLRVISEGHCTVSSNCRRTIRKSVHSSIYVYKYNQSRYYGNNIKEMI